MVHNHPSGDSTPSEEDKMVTKRLAAVGEIIGIPLLDHIIIGKYGSRSIKQPKKNTG
ncbi:JAB domain-containing protein [Pectinatus frisingensis]|uniref:JAB domain-containing protein n=1 Tax=Pectinatus frisingensis TaxID=865 RepID=UPI002ED847AA